MSYYDDYIKMFPTPEAFVAAVEKMSTDSDDNDDISTIGCSPLVAFLQLRNEVFLASSANTKATRKTPTTKHKPVAAPPAPRRRAITRQKAHA
jgi:hypothetical protein